MCRVTKPKWFADIPTIKRAEYTWNLNELLLKTKNSSTDFCSFGAGHIFPWKEVLQSLFGFQCPETAQLVAKKSFNLLTNGWYCGMMKCGVTIQTKHNSLIIESTYMWLFNPSSRLYWPCLEFVPPMFTRHLVFRIILPSCSKFFSEKITLARRGRMAAKRGSIPPIPPTWVWICAQNPWKCHFPLSVVTFFRVLTFTSWFKSQFHR